MKLVESKNGLNLIKVLKFAYLRAIRYPINVVSWFIADLSMYVSTILVFMLLGTTFQDIGGYDKMEIMLFLSNSFLVNNLFSIFFSEAIDNLAIDIWNGEVAYYLLMPKQLHFIYIAKYVNFKSLLSTPLLIIFWLYSLFSCGISINIEAVFSIIIATLIMGAMFFLITNLDFRGIRSNSFNPIFVQILNIREKPDKAFKGLLRDFFIYIIPIFLTSSIPTMIQLSTIGMMEKIWFYVALPILIIVNQLVFKCSLKRYNLGTES